jgi:hypothetical protein
MVNIDCEKNSDLLCWILDSVVRNKIGNDRLVEAQKVYYLLKIMDFIWFENKVPNNLTSHFELILNPSWPGRPPLWFHHLAGLPVECLENIASKLTKPDWLENNSVSTLMKVYGFGYFIAWKNYSKV